MKPLILKLQAFGPYAGRETVDFRPALDSGLFGIYGATGSGKSSIFSAMTFALFGEAAKSEQPTTTLRSHHAEPGLATEVELVFEVGGKRYRIVRRPDQMRPARRGGGETKESQNAKLFEVTGLDLDTLCESNPGKIVAEGKLATVESAITSILGYGAAQFRQIVLLPQGKFETFLTAETKKRLEILRDLFDVSLYRRLTETLKDKARTAEDEIRIARDVCRARLAAEGFETHAALETGIAEAIDRQRAAAETAEAAKARLEAVDQAFQQAARLAECFEAHAKAEADLTRLDEQQPAIAALSARVTGARIALGLADVHAAVSGAAEESNAAAARLRRAAEDYKTAKAAELKAAGALQALAGEAGEIDAARANLLDLKHHARTMTEAAGLRTAAGQAHARAIAAREAAVEARAHHVTSAAELEAARRALEEARTIEARRAALLLQLSEVRSARVAADGYEKITRQLTVLKAEVSSLHQHLQAAARGRADAEAAYRTAEAALVDDHAVTLAGRLGPGSACPVCGSDHHPSLARGTPDTAKRSEIARSAKAALEAADVDYREVSDRYRLAGQRYRDREEALAGMATPPRPAREMAAALAVLEADVAALGPAQDIRSLSDVVQAAHTRALQAQEAHETARDIAAERELSLTAAQSALEEALRAVPEAFRSSQALQTELDALSSQIESWDSAFARSQTELQAARETAVARQRDREHAEVQLSDSQARAAKAKEAFVARLAAHGLDEAAYLSHAADIPLIEKLAAGIEAYREQRRRAETEARLTRARIEGLQRPDLAGAKAARDAAEVEHRTAAEGALAAVHRRRHLESLQAEIGDEMARLDAREAESGALRTLADACAGRSGPRIDLETFAIGTMFDRVLEAANRRLAPMTRGRYGLLRETQSGGGGRQGLGIVVDDAHTGRHRPTATLSGGETFIAALALALGLSEVVESERGSIRLDTIFIDEGFGSLDSENDAGTLEQVLQTLQDLVGRSRAVGLISHVPLVQQTIPNGFVVTASPAGSRIEARR